MEQKVYIIILNYKTWKDSIDCLESVFALNYSNYQVVLVDNFSENESVREIHTWAERYIKTELVFSSDENTTPISNKKNLSFIFLEHGENYKTEWRNKDLIVIRSKVNNGFAAGNNIGMLYALQQNDFDFVWLLNNDTIADQNALSTLVEYMHTNAKIGICGSVILTYAHPDILQGVGGYYNKLTTTATEIFNGKHLDNNLFNNPHKINYPIGAALFVRRDFMKNAGLLNEDYFLFFEEMDWTLRGKKIGWDCGYAKKSIVWHKGSSTINENRQEKTKLSDYFGLKSKLLFTRNFYPLLFPFVYFNLFFVLLNRIRRRQFDRILPLLKIAIQPALSKENILKMIKK
ncbi:MAG: glycosyltransferase family 2 protein [Lacibacter sp.]